MSHSMYLYGTAESDFGAALKDIYLSSAVDVRRPLTVTPQPLTLFTVANFVE